MFLSKTFESQLPLNYKQIIKVDSVIQKYYTFNSGWILRIISKFNVFNIFGRLRVIRPTFCLVSIMTSCEAQ